ncbi:MAG: DUF368 domain-containing protein [Bacteroidales bacterium]|nr:DUF368 domain-containing protein [Bacteroidales bacterium]
MISNIKNYLTLFIKGMAMGVANLTPGVSGGTIAMITGVLEQLTNSIKSLNKTSLTILFKGNIKEFIKTTRPQIPILVFSGVLVAVFLFAKMLSVLLSHYAIYTWSFFFGIVVASIYFIGKKIETWNYKVILSFVLSFLAALSISFLNPATPNPSVWYVFICGIIAISSMILPGMSGSYILVMMGNYQLIFVDAINSLNLLIIIPMGLGNLFGLFTLSHIISYVLTKYKNQTIAVMTGFIFGSLGMLWPWKQSIFKVSAFAIKHIDSTGKPVLIGYKHYLPSITSIETFFALILLLLGIILIWYIEKISNKKTVNIEKTIK